MRERIQAIVSFHRPDRWSGLAALLAGSLAVVGLTDATEGGGDVGSTAAAAASAPTATPSAPPDPEPSGEDTLWGTILLDARPVEGASVTYYDHIRPMGGTGRTDAQGRFEFRDVPGGVWVVRSRHVEWGEFEVQAGEVEGDGSFVVPHVVPGDHVLTIVLETEPGHLASLALGQARRSMCLRQLHHTRTGRKRSIP